MLNKLRIDVINTQLVRNLEYEIKRNDKMEGEIYKLYSNMSYENLQDIC
jgi:hypothetical protein